MNREEQIISEAKKHYSDSINCHNAFLHGVEWADEHPDLSSLWHPADEEPDRRSGGILCEHDLYYWVATQPYLSSIYGNWHKKVKREHLIRWAYISDLLPKGGEE